MSKKFVICPNMGGGQGSGPSHPDGVGPLGSIRWTPFLLLAPVLDQQLDRQIFEITIKFKDGNIFWDTNYVIIGFVFTIINNRIWQVFIFQ